MVRVEVMGRKGKSTYTVHPVAHDIGMTRHIIIIIQTWFEYIIITALHWFLALNEARIVLRIIDQNDNSPIFVNESMPVIAAVSPLTGYGTPVATVQVCILSQSYIFFETDWTPSSNLLGDRPGSGRQFGHTIHDSWRSHRKKIFQRRWKHGSNTNGRRIQSAHEQHRFRIRYTRHRQGRRVQWQIGDYQCFCKFFDT